MNQLDWRPIELICPSYQECILCSDDLVLFKQVSTSAGIQKRRDALKKCYVKNIVLTSFRRSNITAA